MAWNVGAVQPGAGLYWTRLSIAGAFAISIGAGLGWILLRNIPDFHISFVRSLAFAGFWAIGLSALSVSAPVDEFNNQKSIKRWQLAVVIWVTLDLLVAGWGLNPGIALDFYTQTPPNASSVNTMVADGRAYFLPEDEDAIKYNQYFIFDTFDPGLDWFGLRGAYLPNINTLNKIPMVNNYDPMVPGRYARWMEALAEEDIQNRDDLLDLMAVTVIQSEDPAENFGVHFETREGASRINWVPCAVVVGDEESAFELVFSGSADFSSTVILEGAPPDSNYDCSSQVGTATISNESANRIDIEVESQSPGWLVLSDTWYPGWQVEIDGELTEIFHANYLFRAIEIPPGEHSVSFVYRPIWFTAGVIISLLTCSGFVVVTILRKQKRG